MTRDKRLLGSVLVFLLGCSLSVWAAVPPPPSDLEVVPRYGNSRGFVLTWKDNSGNESGFRIERSVNGGVFTHVQPNAGANDQQFFDPFEPPRDMDEVIYRVRAFNREGDSAFSPDSAVTILRVVWPMRDNSHNCANNFGDYTPLNKWDFHDGFDIMGNLSTAQDQQKEVVAARGGRIEEIDPDYAGGCIGIAVDVDGAPRYDRYLHVVVSTAKTAGDVVAAGEVLGRVNATYYPVGSQHLHMGYLNWYNAANHGYEPDGSSFLNPLMNFTRNEDRDPLGNAPALEDHNGDGSTLLLVRSDNQMVARYPAFGGVDIVAEAFDDMTVTRPHNQNVHQVGYWIESLAPGGRDAGSATAPYVLCAFDHRWFTSSPPVEDIFLHVYDATRMGDSRRSGNYILSNAGGTTGAPGDVDENQFWKTNARAGSGSRPNGSDHDSALVNDTAAFADGYYRIHVLLRDLVHPVVDAGQDVLVDNFLPYVKRVTVRSGATLVYEAHWQLVGGSLRLEPPDVNAAVLAAADPTRNVDIEVEFSEPMKSAPTVSITPLGVSPTLSSAQPENNRTIWKATVPAVNLDDSGGDNGQHYLSFSGEDLAGNSLLAIANPDPIDPVASVNRGPGGNFPSVTGDDTLHRFRVGPVSGTQRIVLLCVKYPGVSLPAVTPVSLAGKIQTLLNDYYSEVSWGQVSFTVTTTPRWIPIHQPPTHYFADDMEPLVELVQDAITQAEAQGVNVAGKERIMVLTNDTTDRGDHATTGFWPYRVPGAGTVMLSSSVHNLGTSNAHFTHAVGHHLGLVDLYPYPHVATPRPFVGQWGHMADRARQPHLLSWSKHRLGWISDSGHSAIAIPRPPLGAPIVNSDVTITPLESDEEGAKAVIIEVADRLAYYVENRKQTGLDSELDEGGVIITKVNEQVEPGGGPAVVVDPTGDNNLADACFNAGETFTDANVGLSIRVLPRSGGNETVRINYDPPSGRNDVTITRQDGIWQTPDIWVDAPDEAGEYAADPETVDDDARVGEINRLYCRIWNNGDAPATDFRVIMDIHEPWSTGTDFHKVDEFFVPLLEGSGGHAVFFTEWRAPTGTHTCVRVRIVGAANDDNPYNNQTFENIHRFETPGRSPYKPVVSKFEIGNPYDEEILVYLRVDGLPESWTIELDPEKTRLAPKANAAATVTIIPPQEAPRCSEEHVTITAFTPRGDTMVPLGAITLQVHLVNGQSITHETVVHCRRGEKPGHSAANPLSSGSGRPDCAAITRGCTDPPRPGETVLVVYKSPDGSKIVRQVTTGDNGCFEDYFHLGQAGIWEVNAVLEGDECNQRAQSKPTEETVPDGNPPVGEQKTFDWLSSQ